MTTKKNKELLIDAGFREMTNKRAGKCVVCKTGRGAGEARVVVRGFGWELICRSRACTVAHIEAYDAAAKRALTPLTKEQVAAAHAKHEARIAAGEVSRYMTTEQARDLSAPDDRSTW
jgi:hypothetical protein